MPTVEKRGKSYRITVSSGYDINGKQIRVNTTWKPAPGMTEKQAEKEAHRYAILYEDKVKSGQFISGDIKFAEFSEKWFNEYARSQLKATTLKRYSDCLIRINQAIGHIKLSKLQPQHLNKFYLNLQETGIRTDTKYKLGTDLKKVLKERKITQIELARSANLSESTVRSIANNGNANRTSAEKICKALDIPFKDLFVPADAEKPLSNSTIHYYHHVISSVLSTAVEWQVIISNPAERVKPPKMERKETEYLDEDETAVLLSCLENETILYKALFTLMLYTGLRRGEACGLTWSDIDFEQCTVNVNKSSLYLPEKGIFTDDTKTEMSRRVIKMPTAAVDVLKEYKKKQHLDRIKCGDRWKNSKQLFTTEDGAPLHPDAVSKRFSKFLAKAELPHIKLHALRHTNATLMIANGTDIKTVSKRLGHASITTTGNIYAHAIKSADERAAEALDDIFKKQA